MANRSDYMWDALGDQWNSYVQRDQIATLWDGYVEIASDLLLQLYQADLSKSIANIPVFRRYRWLNYQLNKTKAPPETTLPFRYCYEIDNSDVLSIPRLFGLVQSPEDDEYLRVTAGNTGFISGGNRLIDLSGADFITAGVSPGDTVVFVSGTDLAEEDTDVRFSVRTVEAADTLVLEVDNLTAATAISYRVERGPYLTLLENTHYLVGDSTLCLDELTIPDPSGSGDAWRTIDQKSWAGKFVRDDPRPLGPPGGRGVTTTAVNTASITLGGKTLTDTSADFIVDGAVAGDYLILRPSGIAPSQILTSRLFYRIVNVLDGTHLDVEGTFPLTANQLTYDIVRPSEETFDLVSTEDGTDAFPRAFAFQTTGATELSGTSGEFVAGNLDILEDLSSLFTSGMVGNTVRLLSGTNLTSLELDTYIVIAYIDADHVQLDRPVGTATGTDDVEYMVGELLDISEVTGSFPGDYEFSSQTSNSLVSVDGTVRFVDTQLEAAPYIKYLRDRADRTAQILQGDPVVDRLWAPETIVDQEQLYLNFGFPIQIQQENSQEYKNVLRGLWYAYWNGPSVENIVIGLNLVFDLPFAEKAGVVTDVSIPDTAFIIGSVVGPNFDVSTANSSRLLSFSVDGQPPIFVIFPDDASYPAASVIADIDAAAGQPIASLTADNRIRLSGLTSVQIDTVVGNPGLGFAPGQGDFGTYNVTILGDDGVSDTFQFGSQFPADVEIGQRVVEFEPLTTAVGVFDYINQPEWWNVFGIVQIDPSIPAYSQEDRDVINDIYKNFTFIVRVVADAYARLGSIDVDVTRLFLEQIKPIISDYIFAVASRFFEITVVTDNSELLGTSTPSDEYLEQRRLLGAGREPDTLSLEVELYTRRDIEWNFANQWARNNPVHPTLGNRAAFQTNYHTTAYDDTRLGTEEVSVVTPSTFNVMSGLGVLSYGTSIINGTLAQEYYDPTNGGATNPWLPMNRGFFPMLVVYPAVTFHVEDLVTFTNNYVLSTYGFPPLMFMRPDKSLQLRLDWLFAASPGPRLRINSPGAPGLGFPITSYIIGTGSSSGLLGTVNNS